MAQYNLFFIINKLIICQTKIEKSIKILKFKSFEWMDHLPQGKRCIYIRSIHLENHALTHHHLAPMNISMCQPLTPYILTLKPHHNSFPRKITVLPLFDGSSCN